jgi:hypothetical protein
MGKAASANLQIIDTLQSRFQKKPVFLRVIIEQALNN